MIRNFGCRSILMSFLLSIAGKLQAAAMIGGGNINTNVPVAYYIADDLTVTPIDGDLALATGKIMNIAVNTKGDALLSGLDLTPNSAPLAFFVPSGSFKAKTITGFGSFLGVMFTAPLCAI